MNKSFKNPSIGVWMVIIVVLTIVLVIVTTLLKKDVEETATALSSDHHINVETVVTNDDTQSNQAGVKLADVDPNAPKMIFEAEAGKLDGTTIGSNGTGYSGSGYVTDFSEETDSVHIPVTVEQTGLYTLFLGYRTDHYKETELYIDNEPFGKVELQQSNTFAEIKASRVLLEKGEHTISFYRNWGYYDIDYVALQANEKIDLASAPKTAKLSNPNASAEAIELMDFLNEYAGKYVISGQQSLIHTADIELMTGKKPAIVGFDFIEYSPTRAQYGSKSSEVEAAISWHKAGGIVTFLWHWNAPTGIIDEPGKEWWRGFYTDSVNFNLAETLADKNSEAYQLLLSDMDVIAQQIKILQINEIPVLFRPLHEAEGGWFWWGASGPEAVIELYRLMYDKFVNEHKLNNLIWVWNSVSPDWYPGDDVVDIVSYDSYPVAGDHSPIVNKYDALVELTGGTKYIAMMENGSIPDPDLLEAYGANWGLFITWSGHFLMDGQHNSKQFLQNLYQHPRVITLDELPWNADK